MLCWIRQVGDRLLQQDPATSTLNSDQSPRTRALVPSPGQSFPGCISC
jgi:hypothetical protein